MTALAAATLNWPESSRVDAFNAAIRQVQAARACLSFGLSKAMSDTYKYPGTLDGRYFVVAGRLWRMSNSDLAPEQRQQLVERLMDARRQVGAALKARDAKAGPEARAVGDATKRALGERGLVWWTDGAPDFNRQLVANTPYVHWHAALLSNLPNDSN